MHYRKRLLYILKQIVTSDFKSVKTKFIDQGIDKELVDEYIEAFKKLRDKNRIRNMTDKNIDTWGKKPWDEFVTFIDKLKSEKSKTEEKKEKKVEGAELIAENDEWLVYKISNFYASKIYGSGKWCITRDAKWWNKYSRRSDFYFMLSKTKKEEDTWKKIALQVHIKGDKTYWDNNDASHSELPAKLHMIDFKIDDVVREGSGSKVEDIIDEINAYINDLAGSREEDSSEYESYLFDSEISFRDCDDDVETLIDNVKELCEKLNIAFDDKVLPDICNIEFTSSYYTKDNEIARFNIGEGESELPDEITEMIDDLSEDEKDEIENASFDNGSLQGTNVSYGGESDSFVLVVDEEKLNEKFEELKENESVLELKKTTELDKLALNAKNISTRLRALEKCTNQKVIEKAYKDKDENIRKVAASRIKNPELLDKIFLNKKEKDSVRIAVVQNKNFKNQDLLKKFMLKNQTTHEGRSNFSNLAYVVFNRITDLRWLGAFALKPKTMATCQSWLLERLEPRIQKDPKKYVPYLKKLAAVSKDKNSVLEKIVKVMPKQEQTFFKEVIAFPGIKEEVQIGALEKITSEKTLKEFIKTHELNDDNERLIETAFLGIKKDQNFLIQSLKDEKFKSIQSTIIQNIENEKEVAEWLYNSRGYEIKELLPKINDKKLLKKLLLAPNISARNKYPIVDKIPKDLLKTYIKDIDAKEEDIENSEALIEYIKQRLSQEYDPKDIKDKAVEVYKDLVLSTVDKAIKQNPEASFWDIGIWENYPHKKGYPDLWDYISDVLEKEGMSNIPLRTYLDKISTLDSAKDFRTLFFHILDDAGYGFYDNPKYMYITGNKIIPKLNKLRIWKKDSDPPEEVNALSVGNQSQEEEEEDE